MDSALVKPACIRKKIKPQRLKLFLMALPFVVFVFLFSYIPLMGRALAFFHYRLGLPFNKLEFAGFEYFALIIQYKDDLINALINTLAMSILGLITMPVSVIFSLMLSEVRSVRFKKLVQTTVTIPNFVSWIIVYSLCFAMFSNDGMLNKVLMGLGLIDEPTRFLANSGTAWIFMTFLSLWKSVGWDSIIYLAAIAGIDDTLYEAAKVDGAGRFHCIWHITVPGIMPTFIVLLLLKIGNIFSVGFQQYFVFNNPMLAEKLEVLDMYIYRIGIGTQDYSFATAIGITKSIVSLAILYSVNAISKWIRGETII